MNRIFGMEVEDKFVKDSYKLCQAANSFLKRLRLFLENPKMSPLEDTKRND